MTGGEVALAGVTIITLSFFVGLIAKSLPPR